jgi:predicted nucleic acid-binding protein
LGKIVARRDAAERSMSVTDAFIAATVEVHGLTPVTRNASDFGADVDRRFESVEAGPI